MADQFKTDHVHKDHNSKQTTFTTYQYASSHVDNRQSA